MTSRTKLTALALAAATLMGGCGISDPYADRDRSTPERTSKEPPTGRPGASPEQTIRNAALAWGNWETKTVHSSHMRAIALAEGDAAKQLKQESRQIETSAVANPNQLRSRATVEAVTLKGSGDERRAIVVTRENLTGAGPLGSVGEYQVSLFTVERRDQGWVITKWTRQP